MISHATPDTGNDMENDCSGHGLVRAQSAAVELYRLAALLLASESDALNLVEQTLAQLEVDPCEPEETATAIVRRQLVSEAVTRMSQIDPQAFVIPTSSIEAHSCIEGDDLSAAGMTQAELADLVSGTGRNDMRAWLEGLPPAQRAIFIQRAFLGWDNATTAETMRSGAGSDWQAREVGHVFRQALCSLTTSLVHSAAAHRVMA